MRVHLVDGTYELFRAFFAAPSVTNGSQKTRAGREVGATRGLCRSLLALVTRDGATHVACAFDHVIESFRNELFSGYKTGEGLDPALSEQFPLAERALAALGFVVWPMVKFEADDALASGAARYADAHGVEQVVVCTPDKDLAQCVREERVVTWDRMRGRVYDATGVRQKFGVEPASIPDWLALVGDSADGIPGVPRWGAKSAAVVLARYHRLDDIPPDDKKWDVSVRGAAALAASLREHAQAARLYRTLATLRTDVPLTESVDDLRWRGPRQEALAALCEELEDPRLWARAHKLPHG